MQVGYPIVLCTAGVALLGCQSDAVCADILTKVQLERESITLLQEKKQKASDKINSFESVISFVNSQYEHATNRCRGETVETCRDYFIELVAKPMNDDQVVKYLIGTYNLSDIDKAKKQVISLLEFDMQPYFKQEDKIENEISLKSSRIDDALNSAKCSLENLK